MRRLFTQTVRPFIVSSVVRQQRTALPRAAFSSSPLGKILSSEEPAEKKKEQPKRLFTLAKEPKEKISALTPLKSLGGLSLVSYLAIEATEGHFNLFKSWSVDLASDLKNALSKVQELQVELIDTKDRVEDLEIMVNDLTMFVELKKDEIDRLKAAFAGA